MAELVKRRQGPTLGLPEAALRHHPPRAQGAPDRGATEPNTRSGAVSRRTRSCRRCGTRHRLRGRTARLAAISWPAGFKSIDDLAPDDWRRKNPRFQGENPPRPRDGGARSTGVAKGARAAAFAIRPRLAAGAKARTSCRSPAPVSPQRLEENAGAANVRLTPADFAELDRIAPKGAAVGQRYAPAMMDMVNR